MSETPKKSKLRNIKKEAILLLGTVLSENKDKS